MVSARFAGSLSPAKAIFVSWAKALVGQTEVEIGVGPVTAFGFDPFGGKSVSC